MGDSFSSFYWVGSRFILVSTTTMKFPVILLCVGLSAAAIVKREAEAEADAEADAGVYASHGGYASAPVCTVTPVKECVPRQVENPRKVCQTVFDIHEDTVVTETCEEVVRTVCTQTSETASHHSHIVDKSTRLVEAGVPHAIPHGHGVVAGHAGYHKREAEAEAEPGYRHGAPIRRVHAHVHRPAAYAAPAVVAEPAPAHQVVTPPVCNSVPEKKCAKHPVSTPRKVARTVCDTVVDVTTIEDCHETVTKTCQQSSTSHSSHSAVVGHETKVVATGVDHGVSGVYHGAPVSHGPVAVAATHGGY